MNKLKSIILPITAYLFAFPVGKYLDLFSNKNFNNSIITYFPLK